MESRVPLKFRDGDLSCLCPSCQDGIKAAAKNDQGTLQF